MRLSKPTRVHWSPLESSDSKYLAYWRPSDSSPRVDTFTKDVDQLDFPANIKYVFYSGGANVKKKREEEHEVRIFSTTTFKLLHMTTLIGRTF